jgi:dipeptidyl aminopeptidase/acylaminoacyl peptidase
MIDPSAPNGGTPKLVWDRSTEDRYSDPGRWVYVEDPATDRYVPLRSSDGKYLYLRGNGASPEGDKPFLDRFDLTTAKPERLWQSAAPYYEQVLQVVDANGNQLITQRESPTDPPNVFLRDLRSKTLTPVTRLGDPAPYFAGVKSDLITYPRPDGVKLSATLYLPPGYDKSQGRLPFFFWAYPREFQSANAASQLTGSPYQFKRPGRQNYLMLLMHGYGVLDGPTMPIVGAAGKESNDTYVDQLVASAQAAVDKLVDMGVADRDRIGIGGHSYGAFMTVNLLAHSDIFRTGIAESGAYNRTLTPFDVAIQLREQDQGAGAADPRSAGRQLRHVSDSVGALVRSDQGQWWKCPVRPAAAGATRIYRAGNAAPPVMGIHQLARQVRKGRLAPDTYLGDGNVTSTEVASSTSAPNVSSIVADRRMVCSVPSLPSDGRTRFQFHAPSTTTIRTSTSLTMRATP